MDVAIIIPFHGDEQILAWTLNGFARQEVPTDVNVEVRVCADGGKIPALPEEANSSVCFNAVASPRVGAAEAKNILLLQRPVDIVIFANSDTRPAPGFVMAHVRRLLTLPAGDLVLGSSPYEMPTSGATVFDVLKEGSPIIFFYHQMIAGERYGFRHCWTLNLSARYADLQHIGFFNSRFRPYAYEDIDLGFRLMGAQHNGIYFEPAAETLHRHPMTFDEYLNREELLGIMMPTVHDANPELFIALHGPGNLRDMAGEIAAWVKMDLASHRWVYQRMSEWNSLDEATLGTGAARQRQIMTLYQMQIPLKRLAFRLGFLRGLELRDDAHWQQRTVAGLWRKALGLV